MLVLSRKCGEAISIDGGITLKVLDIRGNRVKLGFECPEDVRILREEILATRPEPRCMETHRTVELVAAH